MLLQHPTWHILDFVFRIVPVLTVSPLAELAQPLQTCKARSLDELDEVGQQEEHVAAMSRLSEQVPCNQVHRQLRLLLNCLVGEGEE